MDQYIEQVLNFIYNLNSTELTILLIITAVLLLIMASRYFGAAGFFVLCFLYLIVYILYSVDAFNLYSEHSTNLNQQDIILQSELNKN